MRHTPYQETNETRQLVDKIEKMSLAYHSNLDQNLLPLNQTWYNFDVDSRMDLAYRHRKQELCKGKVSKFHHNFHSNLSEGTHVISFQMLMLPSVTKLLKCTFIHHNQPYLKLGPFALEQKHQDPEIALLHDFISLEESENVKKLARGKLITTPYMIQCIDYS